MLWLVTGASGQLGHHLQALLEDAPEGDRVACLSRGDLDVSSASDVDAAIAEHSPDVVINAAAYTAVDAAETDEDAALAVNCDGPANIAQALARQGASRLIHVSTDYVFDGTAHRPYEPGDPTAPRTAYGRTKLAGERAALAALPDRCTVVRTAWLYGGPGPNFVDTILRLGRERDHVDVVADQIGSPTYVADLAGALMALGRAATRAPVLHYANAGSASWFDLASAAFALAGLDMEKVRPTTSAAFVRPAPRPVWSVLSLASWIDAGLPAPRNWRDALAAYVRP